MVPFDGGGITNETRLASPDPLQGDPRWSGAVPGTRHAQPGAEEYELEILGPDDDVRCTVTGLVSPTFTHTAAMQTEDFPEGYPASVFAVYQISAQVGRGFAARFEFPDAPELTTLGESIAEGRPVAAPPTFPPTRLWPSARRASPARRSRLPPTSAAAHPATCGSALTPTMQASPAL